MRSVTNGLAEGLSFNLPKSWATTPERTELWIGESQAIAATLIARVQNPAFHRFVLTGLRPLPPTPKRIMSGGERPPQVTPTKYRDELWTQKNHVRDTTNNLQDDWKTRKCLSGPPTRRPRGLQRPKKYPGRASGASRCPVKTSLRHPGAPRGALASRVEGSPANVAGLTCYPPAAIKTNAVMEWIVICPKAHVLAKGGGMSSIICSLTGEASFIGDFSSLIVWL